MNAHPKCSRFISIVLTFCMVVSLLPMSALAARNSAGADARSYEDMPLEVSEEMAASLVSSLTGAPAKKLSATEEGYRFEAPEEWGQRVTGLVSEQLDAEDGAALNQLPQDYVDTSNEYLYKILDEMAVKPALLSDSAETTQVDLVFVIDSTGSMSSAISNVKENVAEFAMEFAEMGVTLRLALIDYRDITADGTDSTTVHQPNHTPWMNVSQFVSALTGVNVGGGGDSDETPIDGLGNLTNGSMLWSSEAYKFAILITDAGCKSNNTHGISGLEQMASLLQEQDIQVSTVTPGNVAEEYGALAAYTGGIQVELAGDFRADLLEYAQVVLGGARPAQDYLFRVADSETNLPVAGALITWNGGNAVTDANGMVTIRTRSNPIPNVVISKAGYVSVNLGNVDVTSQEIFLVPFTMGPEVPDPDETWEPTSLREEMFQNPSSGSGSLAGPTIRLLGRDYNLLDLDIGFNLGELDVSIKGDSEEKKYEVLFGHDFENDSYWEDRYPIYKSIVSKFSQKSAREIYNDFRSLRGSVKKSGNFLLNCDYFLGGYAEVSYATGALNLTSGGIVLGISTGDKPIASGPFLVPWAFFEVTWEMDAKGIFNFVVLRDAKVTFVPQATIEAGPAVTGTLNAGVKGIASVGGGLKGSLDTSLRIPFDTLREGLTVKLSGSFVANLKLLGFKLEAEEPFASVQLYPTGGSRMARAGVLLADEGAERMQPIGAPTPVRTRSAEDQFRNGVYEDSAPQLVRLSDGRYLLVYVDMAPGSETETALYYALSEDGLVWSAPAPVQQGAGDGTSDYTPVLTATGTGAVVVWQDRQTPAEAIGSFEEAAENIELSAAVFDGASFGPEVSLTSGGNTYKTTVRLLSTGDGVTACWLETDPANVMLTGGGVQIQTASLRSGVWSAPETVDAVHISAGGLTGFDAGVVDGTPMVVYAEDGQLRYYGLDGASDRGTLSTSGPLSSLQTVDGRLYWSDARGLVSWDGTSTGVAEDTLWLDGAEFTLLSSEGRRMILVRQSTGFANELYLSVEQDGWTSPVPVTSYGMSLSAAGAVLDHEGRLHWAVGRTEVAEEVAGGASVFGGSDLAVGSYAPEAAVVVSEDAYLSDVELMQAEAGDTVGVSFQLSNQGAAAAEGLYATVAGRDGEEIKSSLYVIDESDPERAEVLLRRMAPGETLWASAKYTLPDAWEADVLTVRIYDGTDRLLGWAQAELPAAAPDLAVEQVQVSRTAEGALVTATIRNLGSDADQVTAVLTQEAVSDRESQSLGRLAAGASQEVSFAVSGDGGRLTASSAYDYKRFTISVSEAGGAEIALANNSASALLAPLAVSQLRFTGLSEAELEEGAITLNADTGETRKLSCELLPEGAAATISWMSDNTQVATVDPEGQVRAVGAGTAHIRAVVNESIGGTPVEASLTVRVTGTVDDAVTGVTLTPASAVLPVGGSTTLRAMVLPESASNQELRWSVEPAGVVELTEEDGRTATVKALANGVAQVTVTTLDGGFTAGSTITVGDEVTVAFDANGGSVSPEHMETVDGMLPELPVPTRSGYSFEGWYTEAAGGTRITEETVFTQNTTVYAHWSAGSSGGGDSSAPSTYSITLPSTDNGSVTASRTRAAAGTTVTLTVSPDRGYTLESLEVLRSNGAAVPLSAGGENTYRFTMPAAQVRVEAVFVRTIDDGDTPLGGLPFQDVSAEAWYRSAVEYVYANGLMAGVSDSAFHPDAATTRGMIVSILYRLEGSPAVSGAASFADVPAGQWYSDAVAWAASEGIVSGYSSSRFGPSDLITREQMASILYRYAQYKGMDTAARAELSAYADAPSVSAWAQTAMQWAVGAELISGTGRNALNPLGFATRAEAAAVLMRFCEK